MDKWKSSKVLLEHRAIFALLYTPRYTARACVYIETYYVDRASRCIGSPTTILGIHGGNKSDISKILSFVSNIEFQLFRRFPNTGPSATPQHHENGK